MIRTKLLSKFAEVFYPIMHFSLGPRSVGSRSTMIEEAYGYLWLLVQNPDTGALMLYLVNDMGVPYNWYRRSDIPPTVSFTNPVSLYLPNSENISWATFAFTEEGEPLFAVQRDLPGGKKIEVYDRHGNLWLEITNAKSPFIVPESMINRKVVGSNVYVFYLTSSDSEIRYQGIIDDSDRGVLTSVPVNARNDLFIVDYTYRNDGLELVYSTGSRNYMYVHIEAEAYHLDEEVSLHSSSSFGRTRKAIREISRLGLFSNLTQSVFGKTYFRQKSDYLEAYSTMKEGIIDKILVENPQEEVSALPSNDHRLVHKTFFWLGTDETNAHSSVSNLFYTKTGITSFNDDSGVLLGLLASIYASLYRETISDSLDEVPDIRESVRAMTQRSETTDPMNLVLEGYGEFYRSAYSSTDSLYSNPKLVLTNIEQSFLQQSYDSFIIEGSLYMAYKQVA